MFISSPIFIAWALLALSILAEIAGTVALRFSNGFTHVWASLGAAALYLLAIWLMSITMKHVDTSITYAVWAAASTAGIAILGWVWFQEPMPPTKMIGLVMIIAGVTALNITSQAH